MSRSSVHAPVDRYFHPPSAAITTMVPDSILAAVLVAPARAAPDEMPAKIPTSISRRVHSIDSRGRTMRLPSRRSTPLLSVKMGGTYPSSRWRRPSTSSPASAISMTDTSLPSSRTTTGSTFWTASASSAHATVSYTHLRAHETVLDL